ncbi:MAG: hypothetical protein ABIR29_09140 [Chthoniobacterales bacterium]
MGQTEARDRGSRKAGIFADPVLVDHGIGNGNNGLPSRPAGRRGHDHRRPGGRFADKFGYARTVITGLVGFSFNGCEARSSAVVGQIVSAHGYAITSVIMAAVLLLSPAR